ncbi:hypothetical protein DICSQDRAFT_152376 [Dichomitus squalens LYAD-421 SS1]|uniref:uncharacterized protein n=1 Tax=Dichomitus squalens (strain LYAD-421) TaxID=732165 RepID=UPI0004414523|nr:uncharacterized protein DICSQDRAFT_152376 [Dichomitus squalens LYAD-421 SS1]EJF65092.1 hypothetical protein DICSQDRAFT_152376 [Dichomitus squalens LYAD-421 SS1]
MEIDYLCANIRQETIRNELPKWMEALAEGHLHKNAADIFTKLNLNFHPAPKSGGLDRSR